MNVECVSSRFFNLKKLFPFKNNHSSNYAFRKPKDGYLIHRRRYTPWIRKLLLLVHKVVKLIVDKIEENRRINEKILQELEVPIDTPISELDAFYKKEFRKKKYMYSFKSRLIRSLPEPKKKHFDFFPDQSKTKVKVSPVEFFKSFGDQGEQTLSSEKK